MTWLPNLLTLTSILVVLVVQIEATGLTSVVCNDTSLNWSFNSKVQTPCQVAANLSAVCASDGTFTIGPLEPVFDNGYLPPDNPTQCTCSTVTYAMISACSLCQGGIVTNWQYWYTNCSNQGTNGSFPFAIPADTYVPKWAFLDVLSPNKFDPLTAQNIGDSPEASPGTAPFTVPGSNKNSSGGGKKSNIGAIVGGVVGGIAVLLLLAVLLWFSLRRKKRTGQTPNLIDERTTPMSDDKTYIASPYHHHTEFPTSPTSPAPSNKPYNPNDPSTFPSMPASPGPDSAHSAQFHGSTYSNYAPQAAQQLPQHVYRPQSNLSAGSAGYAQPAVHGGGGGYTGVAEL